MLRALALSLTFLFAANTAHAASDASDRRARYFLRRYYHGDFRPPGGWYLPPLKIGSAHRPITPGERQAINADIGRHMDRFTAWLWSRFWR